MTDIVIEQKSVGSTAQISLKGKMAENAVYATIRLQGVEAAEFDFEGVTMINSKGVQVWKEFMQALPKEVRLVYKRCPLKVVNQLNLFPSFKGGKTVDVASFYAPYFCDACDKSVPVLLETARFFKPGKAATAPEMSCPDCKKAMEFDANPQKYFLFLQRSF